VAAGGAALMRVAVTAALRALDDALGSLQAEPPDLESAGRGCLAVRDALRSLDLELDPDVVDRSTGARRVDAALARLTQALAMCSDERAAAVRSILRRGAGLLGLPPGATLSGPAGLVPERREAWASLADTLRIDSVGVSGDWREDATWTPTRGGQWESVLATLLVERDWETIERTARELREEWPEEPDPPPPEPAWKGTIRQAVDLLDQTRDTFRSRQLERVRKLLEGLI
jgi:hypothetical protein